MCMYVAFMQTWTAVIQRCLYHHTQDRIAWQSQQLCEGSTFGVTPGTYLNSTSLAHSS